MPVDDAMRARLDDEQRAVLGALVAGETEPDGFADHRLDATRDALLRKRAREAASAWPELSHQLGDRYEPRFVEWASTVPFPSEGGAFADGFGFAAHMSSTEPLDPPAAVERLYARARYRLDATGTARCRRGLFFGVVITADGPAVVWASGAQHRRVRGRAPDVD